MGLKFLTVSEIDSYINPWGCQNSFTQNVPFVNLAAVQAEFPTSELRALVDGGGNILILHLSGFPNTNNNWPNLDIQGNPILDLAAMLDQVSELAPWINNPYNKIRITTGGLWYAAGLVGPAFPNTTAKAIAPAAYILAYGAQMGPIA